MAVNYTHVYNLQWSGYCQKDGFNECRLYYATFHWFQKEFYSKMVAVLSLCDPSDSIVSVDITVE